MKRGKDNDASASKFKDDSMFLHVKRRSIDLNKTLNSMSQLRAKIMNKS